ncbi:MAG: MFS transporter [Chitinophagaceae bacterium]
MRIPALNESSSLRYLTFFYLYIMQGIPAGFALTAIANYLSGKHVEPQRIGTFVAIVGLPWTIQFIWGPLIDRFQYSAIGHRKHWVVISQAVAVLASLGLLLVKDPLHQLSLLSGVFFLHSIFASVQDASVDAMAISIVPADQRGRLNGFMRGGFLLGMAFGSAGLSFVLHEYGFRSAALLQTCILLGCTMVTFFIKLDRGDPLLPSFRHQPKKTMAEASNPDLRELFKKIYAGITNKKSLRYFVIIALVYFCFSVFIRSYTYHLIHVLKWSDKSVSIMQGTWGSAITFVAIILGGIASDKMGARSLQVKIMWVAGLFLILLNLSFYLWRYHLFSSTGLILWSLADPLFSVAAFPILMALCAEQVEGSQFTTYMALINFCDVIGSYVTGYSLGVVSAPVLGFGCGVFVLLLLLLLKRTSNYSLVPA